MKISIALAACLTLLPALAVAQTPRSYTPDTPPRPDEMTLLNTTVTALDMDARTITVRVDKEQDGRGDRAKTETFPLDAAVLSSLAEIKVGTAVLLTLRGRSVVGVKKSIPAAAAGTGRGPAKAPARPRTRNRNRPGGAPVSTGPAGVVGVVGSTPGIVVIQPVPGPAPSPSTPAVVGTPFPTPRPVSTPRPVGAPPAVGKPAPVVLPSDAPPTPIPAPTPTPSPRPWSQAGGPGLSAAVVRAAPPLR